jgi:hypothetical protein
VSARTLPKRSHGFSIVPWALHKSTYNSASFCAGMAAAQKLGMIPSS